MTVTKKDNHSGIRAQSARPADPTPAMLSVRTDLRAGLWQCTSCQGQVLGDQLFRPTCSFCQDV